MIISDKSAVNWPGCRKPLQSPRAVYKKSLTNKSVPRTRKEKCQTRRSGCPAREGRCRSRARLVSFHLRFHACFASTLQEPAAFASDISDTCQSELSESRTRQLVRDLPAASSSDISDRVLSEMSDRRQHS